MNLTHTRIQDRQSGSVLVTTVVMLGLASVAAGAILSTAMHFRHSSEAHGSREKAAFLADSGLNAAIVGLNMHGDGTFSYSGSRELYAQQSAFVASDWGFNTQMTVISNRQFVTSIGRYNGKTAQISAEVSLGDGKRSVHALYAHGVFAGNESGTNYAMIFGGTGSGADYVHGDVYSGGDIERFGEAALRLPEELVMDYNGDGICDPGTDTWHSAYADNVFPAPLSQAEFDAYVASMAPHMGDVYNNGKYDYGEAFVDTIGNGVYDLGEPFEDLNGNGIRDTGDDFIDRNGNGVYDEGIDTVVDLGNGRWDPGEEWTEDILPDRFNRRKNNRYDPAGGYYDSKGIWKTGRFRVNGRYYYPATWPAEEYEDVGDGHYQPGELFTDQNGVYDEGEQYLDDRNSVYDYGVQAIGTISGMPDPETGQSTATGGDPVVKPPDLDRMYYQYGRDETKPGDALPRWGSDVTVRASDYGSAKAITSLSNPRHIFVHNPPTSGSVSSGGKTIYGRTYTPTYETSGTRVSDFFLEDPADSTYNSNPSANRIAQNDGDRTCTMLLNVTAEHNNLTYYVDGNLYIHNPRVYSMRFRDPGTRITIVAKGNIIISDEFYYNADYAPNLQYADMNSSVVINPSDALCLIALKNPDCANSGNILIGDTQFGTGGSIHAMLYAANDFIDNNINTTDQQYISIFGNMSAGNHVRINRQGSGSYRTRLDVTLDERIRDGSIIAPGLPHPVAGNRSIQLDTAWHLVAGSWNSWSPY